MNQQENTHKTGLFWQREYLKATSELLTKSNNKSAQNRANICLKQEVIYQF